MVALQQQGLPAGAGAGTPAAAGVPADTFLCCTVLQVADPLRHFVDGVLSLPNPIGSVGDKVNVGVFRCAPALTDHSIVTLTLIPCEHAVNRFSRCMCASQQQPTGLRVSGVCPCECCWPTLGPEG